MERFDHIRERVGTYYDGRLEQHGATPAGVGWNSLQAQQVRFDALLTVVDAGDAAFTLLDYGCGYGALLDVLASAMPGVDYRGFDISPSMIEAARAAHPAAAHRFTSDAEALEPADFVVASGIFSVKGTVDNAEWRDYVCATMDRIAGLAQRGWACNLLTSYSDPEHMVDRLYYADPLWFFDHCKRRYSKQVALLHDYGLHEFTIRVRRDTP